MTIERRKWSSQVPSLSVLPWPCPTCKYSVLEVKKGSIKQAEISRSKIRKYGEYNEPGYEALFIGYLECIKCSEVIAIAGTAETDIDFDDKGESFSVTLLKINYVNPAPQIFSIPASCPKEVTLHLQQSFQLFWVDLDAAANKVRQAVESLLDLLKVKRRLKTKKGKYERLSLHKRIELFQAKEKELGELLLAIKWLGNSGSHDSAIKTNDIFDAYDIIEHIIVNMFVKPAMQIANLAKEINKKKGPRSKRLKPPTKKSTKKR